MPTRSPGLRHAIHAEVLAGPPDNGRSAAPSFGTDGGVAHMFYEAGERLSGAIAVARAV